MPWSVIKYSPFDASQMVDSIGWMARTDTAMSMKGKVNVAQDDCRLDLQLKLQVPDKILALHPDTVPGDFFVQIVLKAYHHAYHLICAEVLPYMPYGSRILLSWDYNTGFDSLIRTYMEGNRIYPESCGVSRHSWYFGDMIRQIVAKITKKNDVICVPYYMLYYQYFALFILYKNSFSRTISTSHQKILY